MFKVGDKIRHKEENNKWLWEVTRIDNEKFYYICLSYDETSPYDFKEYKGARPLGNAGDFNLVESSTPVSLQSQTKPCTCESRTLFIKGCVCGHLIRRAG